jgi:hypothetical protein
MNASARVHSPGVFSPGKELRKPFVVSLGGPTAGQVDAKIKKRKMSITGIEPHHFRTLLIVLT